MKIAIINGPNLNLLGSRQPQVYGARRFENFLDELRTEFPEHELRYFQSNEEGLLINALQQEAAECQAILLNPGAFTHTSIALADAVAGVDAPVYEVHISNVFAREKFRHHSYISPHAQACLSGFGLDGYRMIIRQLTA